MTVGVSALVVVIGVMSGMQEDLLGKILESSPHVLVQQAGGSLRMDNWETVADRVRKVEGVVAVAPWLLSSVTVMRGDYSQSADMFGVALDPGGPTVTEMETQIQEGVLDLGPTASGLPPVVMGNRLAARLRMLTGDTLTLIAYENTKYDLMGMPTPLHVRTNSRERLRPACTTTTSRTSTCRSRPHRSSWASCRATELVGSECESLITTKRDGCPSPSRLLSVPPSSWRPVGA